MKDSIEIILTPNSHLLRLSCGQCGDTKDLIIEILNDKLSIVIQDSTDLTTLEEEIPEGILTPVHLII